jgi:hypothetical protein
MALLYKLAGGMSKHMRGTGLWLCVLHHIAANANLDMAASVTSHQGSSMRTACCLALQAPLRFKHASNLAIDTLPEDRGSAKLTVNASPGIRQ